MIKRVVIVFLLACTGSLADNPKFPQRFKHNTWLGPLVFRGMEDGSLYFSVAWPPKKPLISLRIDGRVPNNTDTFPLSVRLEYIEPRRSDDPSQAAKFKEAFVKGVQQQLKDDREFSFLVCADWDARGGHVEGVVALGESYDITLQEEMVREGFAVVKSSLETTMVEGFKYDYRDKLLRYEGDAKCKKLGVWEN